MERRRARALEPSDRYIRKWVRILPRHGRFYAMLLLITPRSPLYSAAPDGEGCAISSGAWLPTLARFAENDGYTQ